MLADDHCRRRGPTGCVLLSRWMMSCLASPCAVWQQGNHSWDAWQQQGILFFIDSQVSIKVVGL